jgi:hypothetical protein
MEPARVMAIGAVRANLIDMHRSDGRNGHRGAW